MKMIFFVCMCVEPPDFQKLSVRGSNVFETNHFKRYFFGTKLQTDEDFWKSILSSWNKYQDSGHAVLSEIDFCKVGPILLSNTPAVLISVRFFSFYPLVFFLQRAMIEFFKRRI